MSDVPADPRPVERIERLRFNVRDLEAMTAFYIDALGFKLIEKRPEVSRLQLGGRKIELVRAASSAADYPEPRRANDPWFQHFAIAVADMEAAYAHLSRFSPEPISRGGPQRLPPSTGSVTAYKFRDPEGRPLELSHAPQSPWTAVARTHPRAVFLGVDHTALAISDLEASIAFYTRLGLHIDGRMLNQGPEQARLDGLDDPQVDIVVLRTQDEGPHIELLHYRSPRPAQGNPIEAGDLEATVIVFDRNERACEPASHTLEADFDGHLLQL